MSEPSAKKFLREHLGSLGLPPWPEFSALNEAEQVRKMTSAFRKLREPQVLAIALQLEPLVRKHARTSIEIYMRYLGLDFEPAHHHKMLIKGLEEITRGERDRLMIFMPPGSAKSTYASVVFPAWYLGCHPTHSIIAASHTEELTKRFGRRARNLFATPQHFGAFHVTVSKDSGAAGRWDTAEGGEYYAVGFNGSITGHRADVIIIDDPIRGIEDADSPRIRDKTWDIYINDIVTRCKPGGKQILIQCMAGDTPVLMSDGTGKPLASIRSGDTIATHEDGRLSATKVLNWKSQGLDFTYEIRMMSGITVRANERHPFLVAADGELRWRRLRDLTVGHEILRVINRAEPGRESSARKTAASGLPDAKVYACRTTESADGLRDIARHPSTRFLIEPLISSTGMGSSWASISAFLMPRADDAPFAENFPREPAHPLIGVANFVLTTAIKPEGSEGFFATIATSSSDMERPSGCSSWQLNTSETVDFESDEIVSITPYGFEEVFDIEVERTGNFIANSLVSHNTRWHEDDLAGRILQMEGERWHVIRLPMEAQAGDILGRKPGERLWPEWFTAQMVIDAKRDARSWNAVYQQEPAGEDGDYFKREWFRDYEPAPVNLRIYAASDYAVTDRGGDYTEHGVFGIDGNRNIFVLDWWSGQESAEVWIERQCDLIQKWKPSCWFGEAGPIRRAIEPFLLRRMDERGAFCRLEWLPSIHDKSTRCRAFQALCANGKVFLPKRGADWRSEIVGQLLRFPVGMHDDKVDTCSLLGRGLDYVAAPDVASNVVSLQTRANVAYAGAKRRWGSMHNRGASNRWSS